MLDKVKFVVYNNKPKRLNESEAKKNKENGEMKILAVKKLALTKKALQYRQRISPFFTRGFIREE